MFVCNTYSDSKALSINRLTSAIHKPRPPQKKGTTSGSLLPIRSHSALHLAEEPPASTSARLALSSYGGVKRLWRAIRVCDAKLLMIDDEEIYGRENVD